jgi:shikimate dehydrogenase/3-dehydroquinate dehydratase type I
MQWIVSLTPEVAEDPFVALASPPDGAAVVELRLDLFPDMDVAAAVAACPLPVLATLRSTAEGGRGPDDPLSRAGLLAAARDAGAALVDLEHARDRGLMPGLGLAPEQVVLSWHDPTGTPADLETTVAALHSSPARIVKAVPTATTLAELERVLALHPRFNHRRAHNRRLIAFAMGTVGLASRYLAPLLGPPISFAAWRDDAAAAPGQRSIPRLEAVVGHLPGAPQRIYGVVGADASHSLSPDLHGAAFRAEKLPYLFLPISVPDETELIEVFAPLGDTFFDRVGLPAHGWAVTTPYKFAAAAAAEIVAPRVRRCGAANTLVLRDAVIAADNTDADGAVGSLSALGIDPQGVNAIVQGTGGAARGAAIGLYLAGSEVFLRGRDADRTRDTADELGLGALEAGELPDGPAILVNATPLGSSPDDPSPFSGTDFDPAVGAIDLVYGPRETAFIAAARAAGVPCADGREFLAQQGFAQFAAFTGRLPPKEAMRAAVGREKSEELRVES